MWSDFEPKSILDPSVESLQYFNFAKKKNVMMGERPPIVYSVRLEKENILRAQLIALLK